METSYNYGEDAKSNAGRDRRTLDRLGDIEENLEGLINLMRSMLNRMRGCTDPGKPSEGPTAVPNDGYAGSVERIEDKVSTAHSLLNSLGDYA